MAVVFLQRPDSLSVSPSAREVRPQQDLNQELLLEVTRTGVMSVPRSHEVRPQITFMVKKNNIYSVTVQTAALFSQQPSVPLKADQFKVFARKMNAVISDSEWPVCGLYGAYRPTRAIKKKCKKKIKKLKISIFF